MRPMRRWAACVSVVCLLLGSQALAQQAIVYGGDREFPPYEYLDEDGQQTTLGRGDNTM